LKTNIYIDGFNLYYGAVMGTPYRWLDVKSVCSVLFPSISINRIKYFTADVRALLHDPDAPYRQSLYIRALLTVPTLSVIKGHFVAWPKLMPQFPFAYPKLNTNKAPQRVQVHKTEEKGSDVNLATHLIIDCVERDFHDAIVISNDSDLALPIKMVVSKYGKPVILVNPGRSKTSKELIDAASGYRPSINKKVLKACQFPPSLTDSKGTFTKPPTW
jgi:uncharacterized LabA/DUF88 family protein